MATKIILTSDEAILCPKCAESFPLHQGITKQTIQRYEKEFDEASEKREQEIREDIRKDEERRAKRTYLEKQSELLEQLQASEAALKKAEASVGKAADEARARAILDFEAEKNALAQDLAGKDAAINEFRANELALRKDKQTLQQEKDNLELQVQRRIDQERQAIQEQASKTEAERFHLKEAEFRKKLEDAQRNVEELTRKLERGSQQLQGEVFELEIEQVLRTSFPHDTINPVRKGQRGADVLQIVHTTTGQHCGTIIWEAKRAENWSDKWIQKLKDDQLEAKAELAVIVSTCMPDGNDEPFLVQSGIWIVKEQSVKPIAQTLRLMLIDAYNLKLANTGKSEKVEALYDYLCSPQFAQRVRAVVDTFSTMKRDLDREKGSMMTLWKKREVQIERVTANMSGMVGELQAIASESLPQLESIDLLSLPGSEDA
jgi:hypothetical protein